MGGITVERVSVMGEEGVVDEVEAGAETASGGGRGPAHSSCKEGKHGLSSAEGIIADTHPLTGVSLEISVTSATKHSRIDRCYDYWTTHLSAGWPPGIFLHPNRNLIRNTSSHLQAILLITRTFTICISS